MNELLKVEHLCKFFQVGKGKQLHAVDDVSFNIMEGETIGVVGESGCGKSTLGRTVIHLLESTSGDIYFRGKNITRVNKEELHALRNKMQIIFQDPFSSLNPRMTVQQIIQEPLYLNGMKDKKQLEAETEKLMETVGIARRLANAYPHELDGGRRQRIGIARALSLQPELIVCDEPVSALDVSIQAQVLNLMQDLQEERGIAYMFITHDLSVVRHISQRIIVMYLGQVVESANTEDLFAEPLHPYSKALLSAVPNPNPHKRAQRTLLQGEITSPVNPKPGCRFAARCPYASEECHQPQQLREARNGHFVSCCKV